MSRRTLPLLALALSLALSPAFAEGVEVGDLVKRDFRTPPLASSGLKSLAELHGKPVLIEFWGTR